MFKVICVDDKFFPSQSGLVAPKLTLLNNYTVIREEKSEGMPMYELAEIPRRDRKYFIYDADAFVRIDGPDEVAIAEARIEADVKEMDAQWGRLVSDLENSGNI